MGGHCHRQHVHLIFSEQSDGFRDLDHKLQNLIIGLSRDQNTFDELKDLIQAESASNKQHVSQEFEKVRKLWNTLPSFYDTLRCQIKPVPQNSNVGP